MKVCGAIHPASGLTCDRPAGNHKVHTVAAGVRSVAWPNANYRMSRRQVAALEGEAKLMALAERIREAGRLAESNATGEAGGNRAEHP